MAAKIRQIDGEYYQEVHPFTDSGWIRFHRSLVHQIVPNIDSVSTLKVMLLFLEQTTDKRGIDRPVQLSNRLIADIMNLSPTSVNKAIDELLSIGIIRVTRKGNRSGATEYELNKSFTLLERATYVPTIDTQTNDPNQAYVSTVDTKPNKTQQTYVSTIDTYKAGYVSAVDTQPAFTHQRLARSKDSKKDKKREIESALPKPEPPIAPEISQRPTPQPAVAAPLAPENDNQAINDMANALVEVTKIPPRTGGVLNRAYHDKHLPLARALIVDGYSAAQIRLWYGDRAGYWFQGDYRGRDKGELPTHFAIEETVLRASDWHPPTQEETRAKTPIHRGAGDGKIDAAWASVMTAVKEYGRYRQGELLASLPEPIRRAVQRLGLLRILDADARELAYMKRDFVNHYRDANSNQESLALESKSEQVNSGE